MDYTELQEKFARASANEKKHVEATLPIIKKMYDFISELRQALGTQEIGFEVIAPDKISSDHLCGLISIKNKKFLISFNSKNSDRYGVDTFYMSYTSVKDDSTIDFSKYFPEKERRTTFYFEEPPDYSCHQNIHEFADFIIKHFARAKAREELIKYTLPMGGSRVHIFKEPMPRS